MQRTEHFFENMTMPRFARPAIGGALLGVMGVAYIMIFGWLALGQAKPIPHDQYPMPAFFGDGYGFIAELFGDAFYQLAIDAAFSFRCWRFSVSPRSSARA